MSSVQTRATGSKTCRSDRQRYRLHRVGVELMGQDDSDDEDLMRREVLSGQSCDCEPL